MDDFVSDVLAGFIGMRFANWLGGGLGRGASKKELRKMDEGFQKVLYFDRCRAEFRATKAEILKDQKGLMRDSERKWTTVPLPGEDKEARKKEQDAHLNEWRRLMAVHGTYLNE